MLRDTAKSTLLNVLWTTLGRKNLVRLGRFLSNGGRLDVLNDPETNGETRVQEEFLAGHPSSAPLVVFDVGANIGDWTKVMLELAASRSGETSIHAFEPGDETLVTLHRNLAAWSLTDKVVVNDVALSSKAETRKYYSLGANAGVNGLYPVNDTDPQAISEIETQTLDGYCEQAGLSHVHFVKVDTEGHDMEVLYGAKGMLEKQAIDALQFEYNYRWINARHYLRDAFDYFQPLGYQLGKVTPHGIEFYPGWDPELERFVEANFLAVKPSAVPAFSTISWWKQS